MIAIRWSEDIARSGINGNSPPARCQPGGCAYRLLGGWLHVTIVTQRWWVKKGGSNLPDKWWQGSFGDDAWEVVGYQYRNGVRVEGHPPDYLVKQGSVFMMLVQVAPADDPEKLRYFWAYNPMNRRSISSWLRNIQLAAENSLYYEEP